MICPKCSAEMETVQYHNIEVDRCTMCFGIWFDMLELEDLKAMKGSETIDIGSAAVGKKYNKIQDIKCPVCNAEMIKMVDKKQPHIWYESCSVCYGSTEVIPSEGTVKPFATEPRIIVFWPSL